MILNKESRNQEANRAKWKHGFSQCGMCQAKLMAYLEKGHSLDDVIIFFEQKWVDEPRHQKGKLKPIKNIRRFAMNAIRQTTGNGLYDNYIILNANRLWTPREPILVKGKKADILKENWKINAAKGRYIIAVEKAMNQLDHESKEASAEVGKRQGNMALTITTWGGIGKSQDIL